MKILIYLDGESYDHPPVLMGKIIGHATKAEIHVLIVIPQDGHLEDGEAVADQAREDLEGLSPDIEIKQGTSSEIITSALYQQEFQLIIVNADRRTRFRKSVEVEPQFIKQSSISLLLTEKTKPKIDNILLCTGCKGDDFSLIQQAAGFASALDATVTLLHVFPGSVPSMYAGLDQIDETVEEILQTETPFAQHLRRAVGILKETKVPAEVKIRRGIPIEEIVREIQQSNYDLVMIGTTRVNEGLKEMMMGNLTKKIVDQIALPIMIIGTRNLADS